jgi:twinkle protein
MTQITAKYVSERLATQAEGFVRELLPNGKRDGNDWVVGSLDGDEGKSLKVHLAGEHAGRWKDWATEDHGDLIDLFAQIHGVGISEAINQCCIYLNIIRTQIDSDQKKSYQKAEKPEGRRAVTAAQPVDTFFASRMISAETLRAFKVIAQNDDTAVFPFFRNTGSDEVVHIQFRSVTEKKFWASKGTEMILFGWQAVSPRSRSVIITEGPMDALAWREYGFEAMSVPNGAGESGKNAWIERQYQEMERFDKIYICMDKDKPGEAATKDIVERLGRSRCYVVHLPDPHKDVNSCLMARVPGDVIGQCVRDAKTLDPGELRNASFFTEEVVEHFNPNKKKLAGFTPPWPLLSIDINFGYGQTTILAGWNGSGKTTLAGHITLDAIRQGIRVCVASLEFKSPTYLGWLVRQALCRPDPTPDEIRAAVAQISDKLWAFGTYGNAKLDKIIEVWSYAHARYGCKLFLLDNLSKLNLGAGDKEGKNDRQDDAITKLTEFGVINNAHVLVLAHSRKKFNEHEEVGKLDIKGSGGTTDLADIVLLLHRNKKKERSMLDRSMFAGLPIEEQVRLQASPDAYLTCEKNRHGEIEPRMSLWFDKLSHQFTESERGSPRRYVK